MKTGEATATMLQTGQRKLGRVKRHFVEEGLEISLCGHQGRSPHYDRKMADRLAELEHADSISRDTVRTALKKTKSILGGASTG